MVSTKELLAKRLQQNSQRHQQAQDIIKDAKEFRRNISVDDISKSPFQPRKVFHEDEIRALADSIEEIGLLQPISVRTVAGGKYELVAGERRLRAHQLLGRKTIEALIVEVEDADAALLTLAENLKREDLTDYEIYLGLNQLPDELKKNKQRLAKSLSLNREDMYKYLAFEKLPEVLLTDLNTQPQLLGRTAATAFKKFLADHQDMRQHAENALLKAWEKVKTKTLEQTKAIAYAEQLLKSKQETATTSLVRKIELNGKVAGNIKLDATRLKVSVNVGQIEEEDLAKLENFLIELIEKNKVV